jgi:dihydroflavonol-4-reductase
MAERVFLTGASGFVGGHVLHHLLYAGYEVTALVRPATTRALSQLKAKDGVTVCYGDLRDAGRLVKELANCRFLVHVAAVYSFAPTARKYLHQVNVLGTKSILEAAQLAGIERAIVTSSSATVGPVTTGRPRTEEDWAPEAGAHGYHHSKVLQERVALAARLPTVLILPTAPVGDGDRKPTPTGRMILDFMKGRIVGSMGGGLNVVAVEDVARAHVQALTRGSADERYIVGGENLSLDALWSLLGEICNRQPPRRTVPYPLAYGAGMVDTWRCRFFGGEPLVPLEGVRMARSFMYVSSEKAERVLGHKALPVKQALMQAVDWFQANGYAA